MTNFTRRSALIKAGGATLLTAGAARAAGPPVWLDMDQQALDDAYDQAKYAPNLPQILKRYASNRPQDRSV